MHYFQSHLITGAQWEPNIAMNHRHGGVGRVGNQGECHTHTHSPQRASHWAAQTFLLCSCSQGAGTLPPRRGQDRDIKGMPIAEATHQPYQELASKPRGGQMEFTSLQTFSDQTPPHVLTATGPLLRSSMLPTCQQPSHIPIDSSLFCAPASLARLLDTSRATSKGPSGPSLGAVCNEGLWSFQWLLDLRKSYMCYRNSFQINFLEEEHIPSVPSPTPKAKASFYPTSCLDVEYFYPFLRV